MKIESKFDLGQTIYYLGSGNDVRRSSISSISVRSLDDSYCCVYVLNGERSDYIFSESSLFVSADDAIKAALYVHEQKLRAGINR